MELDRLKVQVNSPPLSGAESGVQERDTVGFVVEGTSVIVKLLLLDSGLEKAPAAFKGRSRQ